MGYLSKLHLYRQIYDYGGYTLDITGPIMIGTQKVTSLGFNLFDGKARKQEDLSEDQKRYAVKKNPSILEFFSYVFSFQTLMCGPLVYYNDYIEFITGENIERHFVRDSKGKVVEKRIPSATRPVLQKLGTSTFYCICILTFLDKINCEYLVDPVFLRDSSFFVYIFYMIVSTSGARFKYFFAWKLGETICNASGLGFQGWKEDGSADWDLVSVLNIWKLETSLNFKILLDNWNKTTQGWLKRCAYDRAPVKIRTVATYTLSAMWHGFYPGYYCCFLTGALVTSGARRGRRTVRQFFQSSPGLRMFYDVVTFILTRFFLAYVVAPFVLLSFESSMKFYRKIYFCGHILALIGLSLPLFIKSSTSRAPSSISTKPSNFEVGGDQFSSNGNSTHTIKSE
jgi:lysophospholipid acyltransferase 1/2